MALEDMRVGDVYVHKIAEEIAYLIIDVKVDMGVDGPVFCYRCLDLIDGRVAWQQGRPGSVVEDAWTLYRG